MSNSKHVFRAFTAARIEERREREQTGAGSGAQNEGSSVMRLLLGVFPLLLIPVAIYNLIAFGFGGSVPPPPEGLSADMVAPAVAPLLEKLNAVALTIPMISGVDWRLNYGDVLILVSVALLFMEVLKSTSTGTATIMNHAVSMLLFIVCLIEFLLFQNFATSVFFILTMITLLDVLAGVVVTIIAARRDFAVGEGLG